MEPTSMAEARAERQRLLGEVEAIQGRLSELKEWFRREGENLARGGEMRGPAYFLKSALRLFDRLIDEGVDLEPDEVALIEGLRLFVRRPRDESRPAHNKGGEG